MDLRIAKWGNSLAIRIPAEFARNAGLKDGDMIQANLTSDGSLALRSAPWDRRAFAAELAQAQDSMTMGTSVIDVLRRDARY